jgi:hypothetical protein
MRRPLVLVGLVALGACGGAQLTGNAFIALDRDFAGYQGWEQFSFDGGEVDAAHPAGPRTVFINHRPDAGAPEFPVGTIIVKQLEFHTLAMVKRGGGYNATGAPGWEWFELFTDPATSKVGVQWRGLGPPAGEQYGRSGQTCNACHGAASGNDSVLSAPLQLQNHP